MNLTARQLNSVEWPPVDLRPKGAGLAAGPIIPGVNWFAPMNAKLVQNKALQFSNRQQRRDFAALGLAGQEAIPKEFDWRNPTSVRQIAKYKSLTDAQILSFINPVFNQGQCGSCWAVSSTMMLSDRFAIQSKSRYIPMDINNVLACTKGQSQGCGGGFMQEAGQYFASDGTTAACFPYNPGMQTAPSCNQVQQQCGDKEKFYAVRGSVREFRGDIDQIQSDIMNNGPIVAGYMVDKSFMEYKGGVFVQPQNLNTVGGHAVVIVGWGYDNNLGRGYWIVRNSWGEQWGERGYFRFAWNDGGDKTDPKYLENMACSWQPKVTVRGGDDNGENKDEPPAPPEPAPPQPKPTSSGLSTGAIVGIVIAVLLVIVIIVLAVYFGMRKKRPSLLSNSDLAALQRGRFGY